MVSLKESKSGGVKIGMEKLILEASTLRFVWVLICKTPWAIGYTHVYEWFYFRHFHAKYKL